MEAILDAREDFVEFGNAYKFTLQFFKGILTCMVRSLHKIEMKSPQGRSDSIHRVQRMMQRKEGRIRPSYPGRGLKPLIQWLILTLHSGPVYTLAYQRRTRGLVSSHNYSNRADHTFTASIYNAFQGMGLPVGIAQSMVTSDGELIAEVWSGARWTR